MTLLRGRTGSSSRACESGISVSVRLMPTWSGSPASPTRTVSSAGMPSSSTSPVTTAYWGSSPVVNLAMRTSPGYRRDGELPLPTLSTVDTAARSAVRTLEESTWEAHRSAHEARVDAWVGPHLARRRERVAHPVEDFLFTYYSQRPAALRRWHPGFGLAVPESSGLLELKGYERFGTGSVAVTEAYVVSQRPLLETLHRLLAATASRQPAYGCFGMHEWAMVYRLDPSNVRHASWPLRLGRT